ncbi:MAG: FG-GAP repeat protein [Pyrinomonadaceae bacterium]
MQVASHALLQSKLSPPLTASDGATGDEFGISVAISGETAIVGLRSVTGT